MTPQRRCKRVPYLVVLVLFPALACRDTEPLPTHYRDLGTDETVLLPTASAWCDPEVAKGQADWPTFRKLEDAGESPDKPGPGKAEDEEAGGEIESEIRGLVDDYNAAVSKGVIEHWIGFFEEKQQETLRPLLEASILLAGKFGELRKQLEAALPDAGERIAKACGSLAEESGLGFKVHKFTAVNDTEAAADAFSGSRRFPVRFVVVDDAWYIRVPIGEEPALASQSALDQTSEACARWLAEVGSGQPGAEKVLQEIESKAKAADTARQANPPRGTGEDSMPEGGNADNEKPETQGADGDNG